ncbi:hypothetical protein BRC89_04815 [Halobacteriales archaeon QS_4_70_19]|nr:MAG: hypothetical protein BRC89_04815 [Halobacteriales archaeon QS_4_70_19]
MQRRVAAIYLVFFVVMGASAYSVIATAHQPAIDVEGEALTQGDSITVDGTEYTVTSLEEQEAGGGDGHGGGGGGTTLAGTLSTTNDSVVFSASLSNGTALSPTNSTWQGKQGEYTATIDDGDTVSYNGSEQTVNVSAGNFSLVNQTGNATASFSVGDTFEHRRNVTTVTGIENGSSATLTWGDNYQVVIPNASNPDEFRALQRFNVSQRLRNDPDVENQTYQGEDGRFVRYRNGTTQPLDEYLPAPGETTFAEGDALTYRATEDPSAPANETTVANVTSEEVELEWTGSRTETTELSEGANVTLGDQQYVAHFKNTSTVLLSSDVSGYQDQIRKQGYYHERMNGLWGVSILSGFGALLVVALAYLPTRG